MRAEVQSPRPAWEAAGLAPTDQLMASAGPAMEVVGRYSEVLDNLGEPVEPDRYLLVARRAVEEAQPSRSTTCRSRPSTRAHASRLSWVRLYGRAVAPKSEARWQALAVGPRPWTRLKGVLTDDGQGCPARAWQRVQGRHRRKRPPSSTWRWRWRDAWSEGLDAVARGARRARARPRRPVPVGRHGIPVVTAARGRPGRNGVDGTGSRTRGHRQRSPVGS